MVHEPYVPMINWRWTVMGAGQRIQLMALKTSADFLFASIEKWARDLGRAFPRKPWAHLPIGSNLPDMRQSRRSERERMGITRDEVVIATLGTGHPSRLGDYIVRSVNAVARKGQKTRLLNLGTGPLSLIDLDHRVRVHTPGPLPGQALARQLASADMFLAPFVDGVSTRRTSLMAALQHGLTLVGTDGPLTDTVLRQAQHALRLVPVGLPDLFASAVEELAESSDKRVALGVGARVLYERSFDWPVLANRLASAFDVAGSSAFAPVA
jgi:glycosyltransferase involved in cell wall biosynthesis